MYIGRQMIIGNKQIPMIKVLGVSMGQLSTLRRQNCASCVNSSLSISMSCTCVQFRVKVRSTTHHNAMKKAKQLQTQFP